ncbi:MAG: YcgL domain-containing protein [Hydrogenovibrio crunogenus]|uniref:YcgL domain-containing protein Tcr_0238 n=1 Tax=Hydrogenovibrio crunogenus (strain DSM 25203 / XCL-2) TaxID=317025 RepID=Y238_HYDCU|nr:RecName: Full=YcgL domain-containing protein Tcr_0238 [Hydrogenovibrio crunogenus XCL-2]MBD3611406.1 YcgL domain-containing protein [Hydrogenovibrio crunogenus]
MALLVSAYKSAKKDELYLFVPKEDGLEKLSDELLVMFGEPQHVIDFDLTEKRKLARVDAEEVKKALETKGYFMQMPPSEIEKMGDMPPPPEHLDNIF